MVTPAVAPETYLYWCWHDHLHLLHLLALLLLKYGLCADDSTSV